MKLGEPNDAWDYNAYARVLYWLGRKEDAVGIFEKALEMDSSLVNARYSKACAYW